MAGLKSMFGLAAVAAMALGAGASASLGQPAKDTKPATTPAPAPAKTPQPAKPADPAKPAPAAGQPGADEMKAYMEAGTPGDFHAKLKPFVGEWHAAVKEMRGPTATESSGTMKNSMSMGGRYLHSKYDGKMGEMEFNGAGVWGYNNLSKQYENTWTDSMSTGISFMTGTCDADGKVFTLSGESIDPISKKKIKEREVTRLVSPEKYVMEFYRPGPDGKEAKVMEITFTKASKSEADEGEKGKKHDKDDDGKKGKKDEKKSGGN